jgi:hypothetical protein
MNQKQREEMADAWTEQVMAQVQAQFDVVRAVCPDPEYVPGTDMLTGPQRLAWLELFGTDIETTPTGGPV